MLHMRYLLNPNIALRSWWMVPCACYYRGRTNAVGLKKEEFELLRQCDGSTDLPDSELLKELLHKGMIQPCGEQHAGLSDWQQYKNCENRYFPKIRWMITGKCNYNCLHCFNAADNAPLMSEWTLKEAEKFLDEAQMCGVNTITISGGEPMLHKNFFEIVEGIYRRDMFVGNLYTNGHFINQEALDRLKAIGCNPIIKISFDGIGHHDWLRNREGAQEDALRAMKLCVDNGFQVSAQTNVHRNNIDSMLATAQMLNDMGVEGMRIIRTTEAPRWVANAGDSTLDIDEYYDRMLEFAEQYKKTSCTMNISIWQLINIYPRSKSYMIVPVMYGENEYRDTHPVCRNNRGAVAVAANGNVIPCQQMSGYYEQHKDYLGNVKTDGLQSLLQGSKYLCEVCRIVKNVAEHDEKCGKCLYFKYCAGGCRAIALALTGDKLAADPSKCLFFGKGYYNKTVEAMEGWTNRSEININ